MVRTKVTSYDLSPEPYTDHAAECGYCSFKMASNQNLTQVSIKKSGVTYKCFMSTDLVQHFKSPNCDPLVKQQIVEAVCQQDNVVASPSCQEENAPVEPQAEPPVEFSHESPVELETGNQAHIWSESEEKALIAAYKDHEESFGGVKCHDTIWNIIANELKKMGINVNVRQVKNKWNQMKKKFKKTVDENSKTGNAKTTWKYLDEFNSMFGNRASTAAAVVFDSGNKEKLKTSTQNLTSTVSSSNNSDSEDSSSSSKQYFEPVPSKKNIQRKRSASQKQEMRNILSNLTSQNDKLLAEIHTQHQEKIQRLDRFLDLFERSFNKNTDSDMAKSPQSQKSPKHT